MANANGFIKYKSVDVYFIFCFAFDFVVPYEAIFDRLVDLGWQPGKPDDRKGRPPFLSIKRKRKSIDNAVESKDINEGGESDYIDTKLMGLLLSKQPKLVYEGHGRETEFDVNVEAWARIFDNGAGCITFRVSPTKVPSFAQIYEIQSLSQRLFEKKTTIARFRWENGKTKDPMFSTFCRLIHGLEADINSDTTLVRLQDTDVMDLHYCRPSTCDDGDESAAIDPYDTDDSRGADVEPQNPYVLTVVEFDESSSFIQEPALDSLKCKELVAILFRMVYPFGGRDELEQVLDNIRIPDELLAQDKYLRNLAWDHRTLMCFARTSSLLACENKEALPARVIRSSMLDGLEIIRSRWHMSILINAQLDHDLENYKIRRSPSNLGVLENLVERRKRFAAFLHDPLPYNFEGGSVGELTKMASAEMQLGDLRKMTIEKFATLDRLHADQTKLVRLRQYSGDDR